MPSQYITVNQISPLHTRRAIRVRLVRTYEVPEFRGGNSSKSKECVFHDAEGTYIHANIAKDQVLKFRDVFQEGKVYKIKNFLVVTNKFKYKTTEHRYLIKFNYATAVQEIEKEFPKFMFRLRSFDSLKNPDEVNDKQLFDVIGLVVEIYSPLEKIIAGRPSRLMDFMIADSQNNRLKCTVWDEHVDSMLPYYNIDSAEPIIVIIQLCRAKIVNGEVRITSSYDATKLWVNHNSQEFQDFRAQLTGGNTPVRSISTATVLSQSTGMSDFAKGGVVISTISDLFEEEKNGDFYVPAEIVGIEGTGKWYYISCMTAGCNKKLLEDEGLLFCSNCSKRWPEGTVRYRLVVRVLDKTGDAPFLLWDRECADLVGLPASLLYQKYKKDDKELPQELENLIGMALIFKVQLKKDQIRNPYTKFTVMRVLRDETLVATYCSRLRDEQDKDLISRMLEEDGNEDSDLDASKGDEVNSPVTAGQDIQKVGDKENSDTIKRCLLDQFSSTKGMKKSKLVSIKKEKD